MEKCLVTDVGTGSFSTPLPRVAAFRASHQERTSDKDPGVDSQTVSFNQVFTEGEGSRAAIVQATAVLFSSLPR